MSHDTKEFWRVFGIIMYRGGMQRLLLRSERNETFSTRIEIYFQGVEYMNLPVTMEGLVLSDVTDVPRERLSQALREIPVDSLGSGYRRIFALQHSRGIGHVVAAYASYDEDTSDSNESMYPGMTPPHEFGELSDDAIRARDELERRVSEYRTNGG